MNKNILIAYLDNGLRKEVLNGGKEDEIIKRYCDYINSNIKPITKGLLFKKSTVTLRSKFIHRKPFAIFQNPNQLYGKSSTEFGDILFVKKIKSNGKLKQIYITFSQVKKYNHGWVIEPHQFEFTSTPEKFEIRFGKIYQQNVLNPFIFKIPKPKKNLFNYLLISDIINISHKITDMTKHYSPGKTFTLDCCLYGSRQNLITYCPRHDYKVFLNSFYFSKINYGEQVVGNQTYSHILDIIYKAHGWVLDPPEEYEDSYTKEKDGGFAIIEIEFNNEEKNDNDV